MRSAFAALIVAACGASDRAVTVAPCEGIACDDRCDRGELDACARAAELYFDGKNGHPLDMPRSFRYATKACTGGNPHGCTFVGFHHQDGLGGPWDPQKAIAAYEQACTGGAGVGCYNLSTIYTGGQGVNADLAKGDDYKQRAGVAWQQACKRGEARWCVNAAFLLDTRVDGKAPSTATMKEMRELDQRGCDARFLVGCVQALRLTMELGELAAEPYVAQLDHLCTQGEPSACREAGAMLLDGQQVKKDPTRGIAFLRRGCDAGDKDACDALGIEEGLGELIAKDDAAAVRHLMMACDRAVARACSSIAKIRARAGDQVGAREMLARTCHMGDGQACDVLGIMVSSGMGGPADEVAAVGWLREGCRQGEMPACGSLIERGVELPVPRDLAAKIYVEACTQGIKGACAHAP